MRSDTDTQPNRSDDQVPTALEASETPTTYAATPTESTDRDERIRVLFLCTHNSACSQVAEAILRVRGGPRVQAFSAGSHPTSVHPMAAALLEEHGIDVSQHRSKSMDEFVGQSFDYIITLCDSVRDQCPAFPGDPIRIHWSFPDPSLIEDKTARARALSTLWLELNTRIGHLLNMPHPASGRRGRPESLAGMTDKTETQQAPQPSGVTQTLATVTEKLHFRHGA